MFFQRSKFEDFKTVRIIRGFNLFVQILLAVLLLGGLNYLASLPAFQARWDIDDNKSHTLSLESRMVLESLAGKMPKGVSAGNPWLRVIVTFSKADSSASREEAYAANSMHRNIVGLVDNLRYAVDDLGIRNVIRFEEADLLKNTKLAEELKKKGVSENLLGKAAIVVVSENKAVAIPPSDLLKISTDGAINAKDVDAFRGEEVLMSAILKAADEAVPVVYCLYGEGEASLSLSDRRFGLSQFAAHLRARRIDVRSLNLSEKVDVPEDAGMLLIADPKIPINRRNEEKISRYLRERDGRVLLLTGPGRNPGLDDLLFDWGVQIIDNYVFEGDKSKYLYDGNIAVSLLADPPHKVAEIIALQKIPLVASQFRQVQRDIGSKEDATRKVSPIIFSSNGGENNIPTSWGERDYRNPPYAYNENRGDVPGPICVAMVAERTAGTRLGFSTSGGRIVVIGAGDLASNAQLENGGNKIFLMNTVNWLLDRDAYLNIPPRPISDFKLNASMPDLIRVAWTFTLVPAGVVLLGLLVAFWRRRN